MRHGGRSEEEAAAEEGPSGCPTQGGATEGGALRRRRGCCGAADAADARRVAQRLGILFYAVDFQREFQRIIDYFVAEYTAGRTPNPCVVCNTWLKFGKLLEYADSVQAEYIATGHYARLFRTPEGRVALGRALDPTKDQSYVLWGIRREVLPRLVFPLGDRRKEEVRQIAARLGLHHVAGKPDSQEICFVPDRDHARFVRANRGGLDTSGEVVTSDGTVVGRHDGLERFTVGQRKGLRIALGQPRYVVRIEPATRRVVIGSRGELARRELAAHGANWLVAAQPRFDCQVKIRYRSQPVAATVELLAGGQFRAEFHEPCHSVAPGQAAVCYQGDQVLGGGWIE